MPNVKRVNRGKEKARKLINLDSPDIKRKLAHIEQQLLRGHNEYEARELFHEYYTITGKEHELRRRHSNSKMEILQQPHETNENGESSKTLLPGEHNANDTGTKPNELINIGCEQDCENGTTSIPTKSENDDESETTTIIKGGENIIEISSDEEWVEEVEEEEPNACCDNITRTNRCAELKLDNSEYQPAVYGTTRKRANAKHWTYVLRPTPFADISTARKANSRDNCIHTPFLQATSSTNLKEAPKGRHYESDEHTSVNANTSAEDVGKLLENGTDTSATCATAGFRLSTLLPLLTSRMLLSTCLTVISYVKSHITFDLDNIQEETILTKRQPQKQQQKQNFANYLFENKIMNSRHYDDELARSPTLRQLEFTIQLKDLEIIKKTIFRQVYLQQRNIDVLTPRIVVSNNKKRLGALMFFLSNIALQNQISVNRLKQLLCNFIFNLNHKKRGLILCGPSDSGKTFLANLLYSNFKPHEIGYFNCPTGPNPSAFLLQALSNCLAYRCDEMVFEHLGVIQLMKQLLEGSNTLTTDVKNKDAMPIDPHPTLITMNSTSKADILKWHPSEYQAFENRCTILFLGTPLLNIFNDKELQEINTCGSELLYMLSMHKLDRDTNTAGVLDKFQDFIFL
ncbi:uncharacterized protein LOC124813806 [Hydra vulgaris]|uniref:uncharacterized protein LOC124813806 n=1 Tax=Hydra vulgaris TaxID=6087 RepID=UPI001F5E4370|nr:uncharacterized protein LOC124813806 [Hydra vulgaris]